MSIRNTVISTPDGGFTRVDVELLRRKLLSMRDELSTRSGGLVEIRKKQIDSSIKKLDKGGFGVCEACKRPLLKSRLLEIPYARFCISCF